MVYLATSIYQKDPKENQKWAATILDHARSLVPDTPEKMSEMNALINIASAYAQIEPAQAFRAVESIVSPLNEFSEASAVMAKFSDYGGNFRQGEYQISASINLLGVYSLPSVLQTLKNKDFDRVLRFTNSFNRLDVRLSLEIQLIDLNLQANSLKGNSIRYSSWRNEDVIIDK